MLQKNVKYREEEMVKNILQCLEKTAEKYPNKVAFADVTREVNYETFVKNAQTVGSFITDKTEKTNTPIVIFMDKTVNCLETMMGVVYSGNFYTIIDTKSPMERIKNIMQTLKPVAVLTDEKNLKKAEMIEIFENIFVYEEMLKETIKKEELQKIRDKAIDTDPMYVLFTSGSTGVPKGTVVSHRSVIAYSNWVVETFEISKDTIFGSQTPFYFSMSILDIFATMQSGATFYIIPKMYFSFPVKLLDFMKEKEINTIYWVPSALGLVANLGALEEVRVPSLQKILFAGEVMPVKQLNKWIKHYPDAMFANLYGPTEVTDICAYYVVNRKFADNETLPIGKACNNCDLLVIKDDQTMAKQGEEGELYVRGSFVADGYYANPEKTASAFVQNPLNKQYPEKVYKTGDIVKYNDLGELIYISRKDFQIKHMGYRIELGEIETAINSIDDVIACACIYDQEQSKIVLYYQSDKIEENSMAILAEQKLLPYMRPNKIICLSKMPYNANGKIDRVKLKKMWKGEE